MTSRELYILTVEANKPVDWTWIQHIDRTYTEEGKLEFCRNTVAEHAPAGASAQLIGRAANLLRTYLFS